MLDTQTKSRIDTARDILVGKVPDPKSQVEQITIALIYKFMDDMDRQSEQVGGKATFFTGEFKKYAWHNLMDIRMSGYERLGLYAEGIERMSRNDAIPPLFREIFKGAFLPYRDPETLNLFLKIINEFVYDHSERLGDAFEYLLSVMDSQGQAGQFRTPRHIIDFIVRVVDPKKQETILDPACGTAGFLISAYKHILAANTKGRTGDRLSGDERERLMGNFHGYDISPDMGRLSRVNLYLHGFPQPSIHEYDTLSSEERWDERYDVIMANPPFMTPTGGIRPHNRFGIKATRSEVLFVDYIAEHLNVHGRAGVIVPEGIIFQSGNAYKQLRKMLVESYLWAVASLPAGVFNPYSGVKTSILFLDKTLARRASQILFVKIENDGFGLGAQRRGIDKNDLPQVQAEIGEYLRRLRTGEPIADFQPTLGLIVEKEKITATGDYNLSGERYGQTAFVRFSDYEFRKLGEICTIRTGKKDVNSGNENGKYPFFTCARKYTYSDEYSFDTEAILIAGNGDVGSVLYYHGKFEAYQRTYVLSDWIGVEGRYLYFLLSDRLKETVSKLKLGNTMPYIKLGMLTDFQIPLPPLEVQKEIVAEIEGYQKVIDGARQVVASWKPQIEIDPEWPMVKLGELCENLDSKRRPVEKSERKSGPYPYYGASGIVDHVDGYLFDGDYLLVSEDGANLLARSTPIAFSISGKNWVNNHAHILRFDSSDRQKFCEIYLNQISFELYITGMAQPKLNQAAMNGIPVPLPPLEVQREIVARIEVERKAVDGCRALIGVYEGKIKRVIDTVWEA